MTGIEIGAQRVTKEIEDEIDRLKETGVEVDRLSFVGYSLGGIVGRFSVGLLYHKGRFDKLKPMVRLHFANSPLLLTYNSPLQHSLLPILVFERLYSVSATSYGMFWVQERFPRQAANSSWSTSFEIPNDHFCLSCAIQTAFL
jgi:hypothetical protein